VKANLGCGPFGQEGFVNLDLFAAPGVTLRADCRRKLPFSDASCKGLHVEHYFEHLSPEDERTIFLSECLRCLEEGGILRIIVPDGELFLRAYFEEGWSGFQRIAAAGDTPANHFATKMEAVNHVFLQGYEHYGAYDYQTLSHVLRAAGYGEVRLCSFRSGSFPGGCIDREQHRPYSLYVEAVKSAPTSDASS
jgi:predicted SAM-dependent methyltransferase